MPGQPGLRERINQYAPLCLVFTCLCVLPFGRIVEIPVVLMALLGAITLLRRWHNWRRDPRFHIFTLAFFCVWIPVLTALPDAIEPETASRIAYNHLRFYFSGIFVLAALRTPQQHQAFGTLVAWLLGIWVLDGCVQWALGADLLGYERVGASINALFGEHSLGYGLTLAVLSPLLLEHARRRWPRTIVAIVAILVTCLVLLSGSRAAWIMLAVVGIGFFILAWVRAERFPWRGMCIALVLGAVGLGSLYRTSPWFESRVTSTVAMLEGKTAITSNSIAHRLWIWGVAGRTFTEHPINGVGARSFRHAYRTYTPAHDPYLALKTPQAPTHAHQLWLEVLTETGLIGALGLAAAHLVLIGAAVRASRDARGRMVGFGIALAAAAFPLNTHMALYSAFWSQLIWWLIALYCAGADRGLGLVRWYLGTRVLRRGKSHLFRWFREAVLADGPAPCGFGRHLVIDADLDDLIQRQIFMYGVYRAEERHTAFLLDRLSPGDTAVDVGAHIGYYSMLMAERAGPKGRIVAFEANPRTAKGLRENLATNGLTQVSVIEAAASDRAGKAVLHLSGADNIGSTSLHYAEGSAGEVCVETVHIGELLGTQYPPPRVIKVDVEGHELAVLEGLSSLLRAHAPDVFVEVNERTLAAADTSATAVFTHMQALGYTGHRIESATRAVASQAPFADFLVYFKKTI